jgi:nickel-type superoxide dismutase maturation protease
MGDELKSSDSMELLLWILRLRRRVRVAGASMSPLLHPGDEVLVDVRAYRGKPPRIGDIVVARHPYQSRLQIIKRVVKVLEDGSYHLAGDNPIESSDSRAFGAMSPMLLLGRVTSRFP